MKGEEESVLVLLEAAFENSGLRVLLFRQKVTTKATRLSDGRQVPGGGRLRWAGGAFRWGVRAMRDGPAWFHRLGSITLGWNAWVTLAVGARGGCLWQGSGPLISLASVGGAARADRRDRGVALALDLVYLG